MESGEVGRAPGLDENREEPGALSRLATKSQSNTGTASKESPDILESGRGGRTNAPAGTLRLLRKIEKHLIAAPGAEYVPRMIRRLFDNDSGF